jgi:hypothetical protein
MNIVISYELRKQFNISYTIRKDLFDIVLVFKISLMAEYYKIYRKTNCPRIPS